MVLARDARQRKLTKLRKSQNKAVSKNKLYYKGASEFHPVHRINLDLLIYNRHNGRLESEMQTWQQSHAIGDHEYDDELHDLIGLFLWDTNRCRIIF